jgi:ankyrin repeat protein
LTQPNEAGELPLHIASRNNYVAGVEILVQCERSLDMTTPHGWTALQLATRYGYEEIIALLLEKGSDPNISGFHGWTALHYAARFGHRKSVELLVKAGARIDALDNDHKTPAQLGHMLI